MAKLKNLAKYKRKLKNIQENSRTGKKWPKLKNNDRKKWPNKKKMIKRKNKMADHKMKITELKMKWPNSKTKLRKFLI